MCDLVFYFFKKNRCFMAQGYWGKNSNKMNDDVIIREATDEDTSKIVELYKKS